MPTHLDKEVKAILGWHNAKIAVPSEQLMKITLEPKSFTKPPSKGQYDKWVNEFLTAILAIDQKLKDG